VSWNGEKEVSYRSYQFTYNFLILPNMNLQLMRVSRRLDKIEEERDIPRWSGYSLGFEITQEYMKESGKTAAELVTTPAKAFVE
jgi:uncharacterized protein YjaZ